MGRTVVRARGGKTRCAICAAAAVDWVHTVDLKGWRRAFLSLHGVETMARVWNDVRAADYQVAIDLQGAIRSAVLARWSGARVLHGAREPRESAAALWYTRQTTARGKHVIEQGLSIVESLVGKKLIAPAVEFPRDAGAEERIEQKLREAEIKKFAILNPGAGWGAKQWPAERYGQVARALARCGVQSVVNYGPGEEELALAAETAGEGAARAFQCSISELIALTRRAKVFVGGDTGPLHLAAALKVPVVAIFGPTDPARNGPYGTRSFVLRNPESPTTHARNPRADEAMLAISVEEVVGAAQALLAGKTTEAQRG